MSPRAPRIAATAWRRLRALGRVLALLAASLSAYGLWLLGWPVAKAAGREEAWRGGAFSAWARRVCRILGMRVEQLGAAPEPPFLLVTNHLGYVDIVLLASLTRCVFVAKSEVRRWPVIGLLAASMGTLFVERGEKRDVRRVADAVRARLAAGQGVVLFPEGTSTPGDAVAPFRSALLEPAAAAGLAVSYAAIRYETPPGEAPARRAVAWWGDMTLAPHWIGLLHLSHFHARIVFGTGPMVDLDRKSLARRLREAVAARFTPMTEPETACLTAAS